MKYRPEIDGLRAIAVISVLLYHIDPALLSGGFLGVDIFFVISGYLISQIILSEYFSTGSFSYKNFYTRRIKRLMPPLWPVLIFSSLAAILLLSDIKFNAYVNSLLASIAFFANHYFAANYGYFNQPDHSSLVLHLWSLSVEEQFYFIWPTALILTFRLPISFNLRIVILTCLAAISFIGATMMASTGRFENEAFYLLPPRAGELLIGCILAMHQYSTLLQKQSSVLGFAGLAMLLTPLLWYDSATVFPGLSALLPCLGAALVISQFNPHSLVNTLFLGNPIFVYIGKISYSLYLWHWPLLAVPRYLFGELTPTWLATLAFIAFLMAHISWQLIEGPTRRSKLSLRATFLYLFILPALCVSAIVAGRALVVNTGTEFVRTSNAGRFQAFCYAKAKEDPHACKFGDLTKPSKAILFGDSHAGHFTPFWDYLGQKHGFSFDAYSAQTCYPLLRVNETDPSVDTSIKDKYHCPRHLSLMNKIVDDYDVIILAAGWSIYFSSNGAPNSFDFGSHLKEQVEQFIKDGKKVVFMAQVPWYKRGVIETYQNTAGVPIRMIRTLIMDEAPQQDLQTDSNVTQSNEILRSLSLNNTNVLYVDPAKTDTEQPSHFRDGKLLYANADHLSPEGSISLAQSYTDNPKLTKSVNQVLSMLSSTPEY